MHLLCDITLSVPAFQVQTPFISSSATVHSLPHPPSITTTSTSSLRTTPLWTLYTKSDSKTSCRTALCVTVQRPDFRSINLQRDCIITSTSISPSDGLVHALVCAAVGNRKTFAFPSLWQMESQLMVSPFWLRTFSNIPWESCYNLVSGDDAVLR